MTYNNNDGSAGHTEQVRHANKSSSEEVSDGGSGLSSVHHIGGYWKAAAAADW